MVLKIVSYWPFKPGNYLLSLLFILFSISLFAQPDIKPIEKSTYDMEIRLYTHISLSGLKNVKILHYHNATWSGTEHTNVNHAKVWKTYVLIPKKDFESLYNSLSEHHIITLPDQRDLLLQLDSTYSFKREDIDRLLSVDGDSYNIEYKTGNNISKYAFVQPEEFAYFYKQVREFKDYLAIKTIFEKELKRR